MQTRGEREQLEGLLQQQYEPSTARLMNGRSHSRSNRGATLTGVAGYW